MGHQSFYFICGVSGVGKTAIIPYLKTLLPANFEVHDFDETGVPDGADRAWRIARTKQWISLGAQKARNGITLVVCGFGNPEEIENLKKEFPNLEITLILLDGVAEVIEQRLRGRNKNSGMKAGLERVVGSVETFIENNTHFVPIIRDICRQHSCPIVDTTHLDPKAVAEKVVELIR